MKQSEARVLARVHGRRARRYAFWAIGAAFATASFAPAFFIAIALGVAALWNLVEAWFQRTVAAEPLEL
jgi:hypothetical protein